MDDYHAEWQTPIEQHQPIAILRVGSTLVIYEGLLNKRPILKASVLLQLMLS